MLRQLTGTAYIIEGNLALLVWHRKFQKWQAPGGHTEEYELPHETALREALEETGVEIELCEVSSENRASFIQTPTSMILPTPYRLMLQEIPTYGDQPKHQHFDFCYVAKRCIPGIPLPKNSEGNAVSWFTLQQLRELHEKSLLFTDTLHLFESLLQLKAR